MTDYNKSVANMLRTLANYLEMSEIPVRIRVGAMFRWKNHKAVKIAVKPIDKFSAELATWSSNEIVDLIKDYQRKHNSTEGSDLLAIFEQAGEKLNGLTK